MTPGSSITGPELRCRHRLRRDLSGSALPRSSRNPFHAGHVFRGFLVHAFATACQVARPPVRIGPIARPPRAFTSRLPTARSPSPLLDMTTTATGLLCWRDSHPLEWQLASLHQIRTCGFPAYGSHLGCVTANVAVCVPAPVTRLPGSESGACFAGPHSPWSPPFAPPTPAADRLRFVRRLHSYYGGVRLLVPVHHRLRLLTFPMRTVPLTRR